MEGGSKRRRRRSRSGATKKAPKKKRTVARRMAKGTKRVLKKAKKLNKSLLSLLSPKKMYN